MNRRGFFSALVGVVPVSGSVPLKPRQLFVQVTPYFCSCGAALIYHGHSYEGTQYMECSSGECPQRGIPIQVPCLPVLPADPKIVSRVRAEEKPAPPQVWPPHCRVKIEYKAFILS